MEEKSKITPKDVLSFWFEQTKEEQWFKKDDEFDRQLTVKFAELHEEIISDKRNVWMNDANGCLALILVLDQFSRNMFRNTAKAFKSDKFSLKIAKLAIENGFDKKVKQGRQFFYMPFMHSESIKEQEKCVELFTQLAKDEGKDIDSVIDYAVQHRHIIRKFQRFPHRNEILKRESTFSEKEFLKENTGF
ncbi:MAG: DUF924 domain-containing protein [Nanoarchaeales archaeon]|nr:DUF924 domain-containing protein [Nanoarchaeales archaeon]